MGFISVLIALGIIVGSIAVFGWWGIAVIIGVYYVFGVLAKLLNPGKREDKYGNWR
jgi:hypothetical protein